MKEGIYMLPDVLRFAFTLFYSTTAYVVAVHTVLLLLLCVVSFYNRNFVVPCTTVKEEPHSRGEGPEAVHLCRVNETRLDTDLVIPKESRIV